MVLVTLLLQPEESLPGLIMLDEPELGLHPYAMDIVAVAGSLKAVALRTQVFLATQSMTLIN